MAPRTNDFEVTETPSTYDLIITSGTQLPDQEENQLMAQVAGQEELDLQYSDQDIEELMDFGQTNFSLPGQQSDQPLGTFSQEEPLASELNGQQFSQPIDNTFEGALSFQLPDQQYGQPIDNTVSQGGALSFQLSGQPFNQPIDVLSSQLPSQQFSQPMDSTVSQEVPLSFRLTGQQFSQPMENTDSQKRPLSLQFPGQNFVQSPDQISVQETPVFQLPDQRTFQRRHYPYRQPQTNVPSQGIPKCLHRSSYRPLANLPDQGALQLPLQNYFQPVAQVFSQEAPASQISDQQLAELSLPGFHQARLDLQQPSQSHPPLLSLPQITPQQQETQENASAQLELDQATIQVLELLFPPRKPTSSRGRLQLPVQPQNVQQDGSKMGRALMNIGQPAAQEQNILPEQPQQPQHEGQDTLGMDLALANYEQTEPQGLEIFFDEPKQSSQGIMLSRQEQDKEKLRLLRLRVAFLQNPEANPLPPSVAPELGHQKSARPRIGTQWQHNTFGEFLNLED
ncbi:hypothetical protein CMQ_1570 [Grosmannia clavigera kw1407]|uniref:Uncharacterized protein n=1 Tax=Grosmannia clavigera (strain kw1407 / UAMH 11150) TaxID=655863 RepID=F0XEJ5_GROCL|nr:uncharacterized protein CMQ_1570 [Grosmannia clavigera kw1407]EFX04642.1 hypothetical protein CMQ_1570 [Grosmannia clavigera kw1407]